MKRQFFFFFFKAYTIVEHAVSFRCYFLFSCPLLIKLEAKLMDHLYCDWPLIRVAAGRCTSWWWAHKKLGEKRTIYVLFFLLLFFGVNNKKNQNPEWMMTIGRTCKYTKGSLITICINPFYFLFTELPQKSLSLWNQFDRYLFGHPHEKN